MKQFFFHDGANEKGPFDIEQLKLYPLKKDTPVWYEGLENWTTAEAVDALKSLFLTQAAPPAFKKNIEEINPSPPKIDTASYSEQFLKDFADNKKNQL